MSPSTGTAVTELRVGAEPEAAGRARALVAEALAGADDDVREGARLVVTELVTNAQLHGRPPVVVRVGVTGQRARVEVEDAGRSALVLPVQSTDAMTGRGLSLVRALSAEWGVRPLPEGGKAVWAELSPQDAAPGGEPSVDELDVEALLAAWEDDEAVEPRYEVRLGAVPTDLLLDAKRHIDNVVRELTLEQAGADARRPLPDGVAALVRTVTEDFALARTEIKRQAALAASRGDVQTELVLHLPVSSVAAGERYLAALDEADRYARAARLLTLETPSLHRVFRRWYVRSLVEQLRARAAGQHPDPPRTFVQVLGDEVTALSELRGEAHRLHVLQRVTAVLTGLDTAEEMAQAVVDEAAGSLDALGARVHLVGPQGLRSVAVRGARTGCAEAEVLDLDEDLPEPVVLRTGEPLVLTGVEQLVARFPALAGPHLDERTVVVVPLAVGAHRLGVLALALPVAGRLSQEDRLAFVRALADALAQALERLAVEHALRRERDVVRSLHEVGQAVTSSLDTTEVVQVVTDAATRATGAQFGAFFYNVTDDRGESFSLYTISGVPREAFSRFPMPRTTDVFGPTFRGEGVVRSDDITADRRYGRSAPHHGMPAGHLPVRSYLAVPVRLRDGEVAGGLFFGHADPGVFGEDAEQLAVGIAGYAAIALDNGRLYDAARRESRLVQRTAAALERPLRPPALPHVDHLELAAAFHPYGGEGELGGDFYEAFPLRSGRWLVALGDVSGKGPEAAAVTGLVRDTLWAAARASDDLLETVRLVNEALLRSDSGRFATLVAAVVTPGEEGTALSAVWCGHPPAVLLHADGRRTLVSGPGVPLGLFDDVMVEPQELRLAPGDALLAHTDGLTERAGAVLSDEELLELLTDHRDRPLAELLEGVVAAVDARWPRRDDTALLAVRALPG